MVGLFRFVVEARGLERRELVSGGCCDTRMRRAEYWSYLSLRQASLGQKTHQKCVLNDVFRIATQGRNKHKRQTTEFEVRTAAQGDGLQFVDLPPSPSSVSFRCGSGVSTAGTAPCSLERTSHCQTRYNYAGTYSACFTELRHSDANLQGTRRGSER